MLSLLLFVTSLVCISGSTRLDASGVDLSDAACLCTTTSSVLIRDAACGNVIGIANEGQCFENSAVRESCESGGQTVDFYKLTYNGQEGWIDSTFLDVGPDRRCATELRAIIIGDWGERLLNGQDQVAAGMALWSDTNNPAWIITTGDNIYPNGIDSWDDPQMDRKWRDVYYQDSIRNLSWYVSVGNHDFGDGGNEWNQVELSQHEPRWILPHLWYDFVENMADHSVHFVIIDTESFGRQINDYEVMIDWFETTLRESTADWLFVIGHRHAFSAGDVLYGPVTGNIVDTLVPVMLQYNVDAYVCGHDHNLQHLQNMTDPDGMQYIVAGAGGALPSRYIPENEEYIRNVYNVSTEFFQIAYGFNTLTTHQNDIRIDFFDEDANFLYAYTRPQQRRRKRKQG